MQQPTFPSHITDALVRLHLMSLSFIRLFALLWLLAFTALSLFPNFMTHALQRSAYLIADEQLYRSSKSGQSSGCTALTAMVVGRQLSVAHAGDSRAVLSQCGRAVDLTHDHKPSASAEKARIYTAGEGDEHFCLSRFSCRGVLQGCTLT